MSEFKRSKKFSFDDEPKKEEPKVEEPAAESPSVFDAPVGEPIEKAEPAGDVKETLEKLAEDHKETMESLAKAEPAEEPKEEVKLKDFGVPDAPKAVKEPEKPAKSPEKKADDEWVQPEGSVIPKVFNLRDEITKLLVVNKDEEMCKTLITFNGMNSNYYIIPVSPRATYDAWKLYAEHEKPIPGKFMELVFDILKVKNRAYFHKVSIVELR